MSGAIRQVTISGRVQGVGYRAWVEHQAMAHDLEGWVRNRRDGSVEALFAGPEDVVAEWSRCAGAGRHRRGSMPFTEEPGQFRCAEFAAARRAVFGAADDLRSTRSRAVQGDVRKIRDLYPARR